MARMVRTPAPASPTTAHAGPIEALPGIEAHPHARAVLGPAVAPGAPDARPPSHAYLFHGPAGAGKRTIARAFAAALLADGAPDAEAARTARERVMRRAHPDLTWVTPSGAAEMLVSDIEQPVVAAAARTPFEASRRVFVIEAAHTLNDQAANRLLKTLEEPPAFAHLLLLSDRREDVLATIASRCQHVRFDPLAPHTIAARLAGSDPDRHALACARLALGDVGLAARLYGEQGQGLRAAAEGYVRSALAGTTADRRWTELLETAKAAGEQAGESSQELLERELELAPRKERKRLEREALEGRRRAERRARAGALEQGLRLAELWLRDVLCLVEGAGELVYAVDRSPELEADAKSRASACVREGVQLVQDTRARLALNVSEELALEALAYRLQALLSA
jgi:DNA polymerase-3 subunit delta'